MQRWKRYRKAKAPLCADRCGKKFSLNNSWEKVFQIKLFQFFNLNLPRVILLNFKNYKFFQRPDDKVTLVSLGEK